MGAVNVAMWYDTCVETFDTRADGSAAVTKAAVEVRSGEGFATLVLWSQLTYGGYDPDGRTVTAESEEVGVPVMIAEIDFDRARMAVDEKGLPASLVEESKTLFGFLELLGAVGSRDGKGNPRRLLRCDIDGATIWQAESDE